MQGDHPFRAAAHALELLLHFRRLFAQELPNALVIAKHRPERQRHDRLEGLEHPRVDVRVRARARAKPGHIPNVRVERLVLEILARHVRNRRRETLRLYPTNGLGINSVHLCVQWLGDDRVDVDELRHSSKGDSTITRRGASTSASAGMSSAWARLRSLI